MVKREVLKDAGAGLKNRGIFVRIPKTASTSVESILSDHPNVILNSKLKILPPNKGESSWSNVGLSNLWIQTIGEDKWDKSFSFVFVRNPYDRAVSSWQHICRMLRKGNLIADRSQIKLNLVTFFSKVSTKLFHRPVTEGISFDDFLYFLESEMLVGGAKWHSTEQYIHLTDPDGKIIVDFVGRYENLQNDFTKICETLGIQAAQLPYLKRAKSRREYTHYYNGTRKKIIEKIYKKDIELFGYCFTTKT